MSADGAGRVPVPCCLALGDPARAPTGCLMGLMAAFGGIIPVGTSQSCCCRCLCLRSEPQTRALRTPHSLRRGPAVPASHEATAFPPGPGVHRSSYVPFRSRVSVSPTCVEFLQSHLLSLKAGFSGGPSSHRQSPRLGRPRGLGPLMPGGELLQCDCFPVCALPPRRVRGWFYCASCPFTVASLSLGMEYLFNSSSVVFAF